MILTVHNLKKTIKGKLLLNGVNLLVPRGGITTVLGKSGAGKSIILKSIVGLFSPDSGSIVFNDTDLLHAPPKKVAALRKKIGYLFQHAALFDFLTVEENISFTLRECLKIHSKTEISRRVKESLEWVELEKSHTMYPHELSGGMQKRVAVARTLVLQPDLFLFDEPTTGLDPILSDTIMQLILRVNKEFGISCVVITHNFQIARMISDKIIFIDDGSILFDGTVQQFIQSTIPHVRKMISHSGVLA